DLPKEAFQAQPADQESALSRWLVKNADQLKNVEKLVGQSPALRQAIRDLASYRPKEGGSPLGIDTASLNQQLLRLNKSLGADRLLENVDWSVVKKMPMPN